MNKKTIEYPIIESTKARLLWLALLCLVCLIAITVLPAVASGQNNTAAPTGGNLLTVNKVLVPASDPGQFVMNSNGTVGLAGGDGATAQSYVIVGDSASFSEIGQPGTSTLLGFYTTSYSCVDASDTVITSGTGTSGTIASMPNSEVTCTVTNTRKTRISILLDTVPAGDPTDFNFTHNVKFNGNVLSGGSFILDDDLANPDRGDNINYLNVDVGTYTVTQEANSDFTTTVDCTGGTTSVNGSTVEITIAETGVVVCTYTNTLIPDPILTVTKVLIPASDSGQFVMSANGTLGTAGGNGATSSAMVTADETALFAEAVKPGTSLGSYDTSYACINASNTVLTSGAGTFGSFTMPSSDVTCTITNTRKTRISIYKNTVPNAPTDFNFTHNIKANGVLISGGDFILDDDPTNSDRANNVSYLGVDAGTYTVTEEANSNYTTAISCTGGITSINGSTVEITIADQEVVVCTYTNTTTVIPDPILTLQKVVINDNVGTASASDFTLSATGSSGSFSGTGAPDKDDSEATISSSVDAGVFYTLTESDDTNYFVETDWTCTNNGVGMADFDLTNGFAISLPMGADVTCTITNNDKAISAVNMVGVSAETLPSSLILTITLTLLLALGTLITVNKRQRPD